MGWAPNRIFVNPLVFFTTSTENTVETFPLDDRKKIQETQGSFKYVAAKLL